MLQNDLYFIAIVDADAEKITSEVSINAGHPIFKGHFPGSPVLPGVIQLQIVKRVMEMHLGRALAMKELSTCKFLEVLDPVKIPVMTIEIKYKQSEALEVTASGTSGATTFFKTRASYL